MQYNHEVIVPNEDLPFKMFLFEGSLTFYLNDVEPQLHPGEFVIVNSNEIHAIDAPCPNQTVVVQMALKTFQDYFTEEQYIWFTHESTTQAAGCNVLVVYLGNFGPEISETIEGKFPYTHKDTFMGFHCGNTASGKLSFCEMKYQLIMARSLPEEVTQGMLEGDIVPGDITFFRLQSTADCQLRAYIAQGEVLPVATRSFGSIGVFAIPEMGRFYRHVLIEKNFPHHGAVAFGNYGKALFEVFKYIGVPVEEIGYNQPAGVRYPTENPWK